jgi:chromosome partitioning protein
MIITFENQKGGVGKTTLSLHVAHERARQGRRVLVIDADPQGSARDWLAAREDPAPFTLVGLDRPTIHRELEKLVADYDDVVIDGPPRVTAVARSAILAADVVVIPVQPSPYDVWAAQETVELVRESIVFKEHLIAVFAINREIVNTAISRDVVEALSQTDLAVLRSHVCQRVAFAESVTRGQTVFETRSDEKAMREISSLTAEIASLIPGDAI